MLCCCYPNSTTNEFTPGPLGTKALFWCAGVPTKVTWSMRGEGHAFMTLLVKKFNKSLSWEEQFKLIHVKQTARIDKETVTATPQQYIYGDFPMNDKVFRI